MDESWYYSIDVTAQFITADDLGLKDDPATGFYADPEEEPTDNAVALLKAIGVDVATAVEDGDLEGFEAALAAGKDVRLDGTVASTEAVSKDGFNETYNLLWTEGGILSGGTINVENGYYGFFINNENNWPVDGDGAAEATVDGTTFVAKNTNTAVYTQAIDAPVVLKNLKVTSDTVGIWAEIDGDEAILEECTVVSQNNAPEGYPWLNSAVAVAGKGNMVINSGTYTGNYAAYVLSSGGTITINGGHFDGALAADGADSKIVIKGGTFTEDPTPFVDTANYDITHNGTVYAVTDK